MLPSLDPGSPCWAGAGTAITTFPRNPVTNPPVDPSRCVKGTLNYTSLPLLGWLNSSDSQPWGELGSLDATLMGKNFPSECTHEPTTGTPG